MLSYIKTRLKKHNIKIGYHDPMMSFVEGIFSRGDERAGQLLFDAWNKGAKFDAWEEHFDANLWQEVINSQNWNVEEETCRKRELTEKFPWDNILIGTSSDYMKAEWNYSLCGKLTSGCITECEHKCGVCTSKLLHKEKATVIDAPKEDNEESSDEDTDNIYISAEDNKNLKKQQYEPGARYRVIFSFKKTGMQIFLGHLDIMRLFEKAFQRSMLNIKFTAGFNPKPKLEFASPLSLGIESENEIAAVETLVPYNNAEFVSKLNSVLPNGIYVKDAVCKKNLTGEKIVSLMSLYCGSAYRLTYRGNKDYEKILRDYVIKNNLEHYVKIGNCITEKNCYNVEINIPKAETPAITLPVTVLAEPNKPGGKSMLKILKEALENQNPIAEIYVIREKIFAGKNLEDYLLFFR
jgi:radical SAM-linked protein